MNFAHSGIEPKTFRFQVRSDNHCATDLILLYTTKGNVIVHLGF